MDYSKYYEARDVIEKMLEQDLVGPLSDNEIITDIDPIRYYSMGILYPQNYMVHQEEQEKDRLEDDTESSDKALNMCNSANPSSFAASFTTKASLEKFVISCSFAWYKASDKKNVTSEIHPFIWSRYHDNKEFVYHTDDSSGTIFKVCSGLEIQVFMQREYKDGSKTYTVALINNYKAGRDIKTNNEQSFFQSQLEISGTDKEVFIEKQLRVGFSKDSELLNLEMLYRHNKTFAVGHGCSVDWKAEGDHAYLILTTSLPKYNLFQMMPSFHVDKKVLSWKMLSEGGKEEIIHSLKQLTNSYGNWIDKTAAEAHKLPGKYIECADENLRLCREALDRLNSSIDLLKEDNDIFKAFQLANQAMLQQRVRQLEFRNEKYSMDVIGWYPFQLAFVLQEIRSVADPNDKYRNVVDLLWFPTGGGKTEAYLGLSAFTIFYRRIRSYRKKASGAGVTIIMRYTLRLLTLQQYERASSLICACELIRRKYPEILGKEEISIGLWAGEGLTPNWREDAQKGLKKILEEGFDSLKEKDHNPCQILSCPWCGNVIRPVDYEVTKSKMIIRCRNTNCDFKDGLPLYLIDEDIYQYKPSLILSTVDKFARMTWEKRVGELFSVSSKKLPPELIIQDELHLISGPLGTITGLYEIAIEMFCKHENWNSKIIGSTATIRNAKNQILNLYGKDFRQFPPQGLDIRDSYFAEESTPVDSPSRKYFGVMAPGKSATTMLVRIYGVLLYATRYLKDLGYPDDIVDSFWTITGYFNNLKQLGGAVVHVLDDVQARFKYIYGTKFKESAYPLFTSERDFANYEELTSRKKSTEIADILKRLEKKYPDESAFDFIMASNMISVGVDVGRLGVMFVNGQPKSNAEYIQATSRVGRRTPGLVIILQDASRSRDRSHYEQFKSYHSSIYKFVEATSLTPFSERARERALHAVLISMSRHLVNGLRDNDEAKNVSLYKPEIEKMIAFILDKVELIDKREKAATHMQLLAILTEWEAKASSDLVYQKQKKDNGIPLLSYIENPYGGGFPTLNTMRTVDSESKVYLEG
ncbi:Helicase conserved C-terminal domain-containing protein [Paenibacillus sp. 1_12]|uniref:helicase-related protein n=1 Tax=Paenibacillus sp. 1_12 TaxID=1566278 RepID=UPI0008EA7111|nr:helicase-related protein [Paenibacillus sp. 1_12]SFK75655.1 Helicase conserved C-terminal domain-containing protein [Paenibacillus sp. 1_12]